MTQRHKFYTVLIAYVIKGEFPSYLAVQEGKLDEEKRVFCVGMTRAKKQLYITGFKMNGRGWTNQPSRFITMFGRENIDYCFTK